MSDEVFDPGLITAGPGQRERVGGGGVLLWCSAVEALCTLHLSPVPCCVFACSGEQAHLDARRGEGGDEQSECRDRLAFFSLES